MILTRDELLEHRFLVINSSIQADMASELMCDLLLLDDDCHKDITLYINSPGGEVVAGNQIIDTMNAIQSHVITVNVGMCASMGALILSSGAKRLSYPHARVMIHEVSAGTEGKIRDMEAALKNTSEINRTAMTMLANNCGKTYEQIMKDVRQDLWMNAEEAIKYGLIDEIVGREERIAKEG